MEAHSAVLSELSELFPRARFVSLSHSIGAYISLRVSKGSSKERGILNMSQVARRFPEKVTAIVALQPTISNLAQTPNGRVMKHFFVEPVRSVLAFLGAFLVKAFPFILSLLFRSWPKLSVKHLHNFLASSATSYAAMTMASDEMVMVAELDTVLLTEMKGKLHILYSETGDQWVGNNSDEVVRVLATPARIKFAPIPHAFCLSECSLIAWSNKLTSRIDHNAEAAEACMSWISQAYRAHTEA